MKTYKVSPRRTLKGRPAVPGDKSISHRGLIFGALAQGRTRVSHILESEDVQSTARCLKALGVQIAKSGDHTLIDGVGAHGLKSPSNDLDCGNSGTTMRLLMGVLAGQKLTANMTGDQSLVKRPMRRVAEPLELMGARFALTNKNFAPLTVTGGELHGIHYDLKVASAQIKTAILLAGLLAQGSTTISGETQSRDHTERLLKCFGPEVKTSSSGISIAGGQPLHAAEIRVPGDPSTAAFWIGAAAIVPDGDVTLEHISLNPTRMGFIEVLKRMGARIEIEVTVKEPEPMGTIRVRSSKLKGTIIEASEIPSLIDEIPLLSVIAAFAEGTTEVKGARELKVKETDRLEALATNLRAMGAAIEVKDDGFIMNGPQQLKGAVVESFHDHRIAMAFSIAGLRAKGTTEITNPDCVSISYPEFFKTLEELTR